MKKLELSSDLSLPINAVTQKMGFLGISGSGKTYGAGKFVEELLEARAQVVVIDTIGNWWGLRLGPNGKKPGFSIPILGGERGDVPLESTHGKLVAETVATTKASIIVDVSDFTGGELRRFVTEFATQLLRLKKQHKSPVMIVWEECQDIVPQRVMGEVAHMVGAVEKLIKKGRNYGIGTVLISQRSAAVNKDVLNQIETLFCFRQNAKHDRKAIEDWIVHQDIDIGELVDELPTLATGTCFCWSPQWLGVLKKVKIGKKQTFDASATPEFGDDIQAGELAPVDLEKFKKSMGDAIEKAKANDPGVLRQQILELRKQLEQAQAKTVEKVVEKPILKMADLKRMTKLAEGLLASTARLAPMQQAMTIELGKVLSALQRPQARTFFLNEKHELPNISVARVPKAKDPTLERTVVYPETNGSLGRCEMSMLRALAMRHPTALDRNQLSTLSGYSIKSSGFVNSLSKLNTGGYVSKGSEGISLTDKGLSTVGSVPRPQTPEELLAMWSSKLPSREVEMLRALQKAGEAGLTREELADQANLSITSSGFVNYLSHLNTNGLIRKEAGVIKASLLFLGQ